MAIKSAGEKNIVYRSARIAKVIKGVSLGLDYGERITQLFIQTPIQQCMFS